MSNEDDRFATGRNREYVDVRDVHPDWREETCWNCGNTERVRRIWRVCHECFMGQQQANRDAESVTDEGYTDYGLLWYGEADDREEYKRQYEQNTAETSDRLLRDRAMEREVRI